MDDQTSGLVNAVQGGGSIERLIEPKVEDLGGFTVRRALPSPQQPMVGPFIFFDHIGPAEFDPGQGIQVRPHPHIGLATITYLFEGEIVHRDSLGFVQPIQAAAVNLMTAGRGIVHSERTPPATGAATKLHGIQCWMALPDAEEEREPAFVHYPAAELPEFEIASATIRVIVGAAYGRHSPVTTYSPMLYLECRVPAGTELPLPEHCGELAVYVVSGDIAIDGRTIGDGVMAIARAGRSMVLRAGSDSHVMVLGGDPVGHRHIWWNFVSSSRDRIERAKDDWRQDRFGYVPGETEFIPLPD